MESGDEKEKRASWLDKELERVLETNRFTIDYRPQRRGYVFSTTTDKGYQWRKFIEEETLDIFNDEEALTYVVQIATRFTAPGEIGLSMKRFATAMIGFFVFASITYILTPVLIPRQISVYFSVVGYLPVFALLIAKDRRRRRYEADIEAHRFRKDLPQVLLKLIIHTDSPREKANLERRLDKLRER
ncbi:MAG: hypothetical protein BAJATHORv1_10524 [Candidatus Thorarchaeota archaeon]|nr:MAG: hypothetical protein BAJATHORv1_10524 [Candidatus Thorarchaeota archaeon]